MVSVIGAYVRTPRIRIAAMLYFLLAGLLTRVPLFNYLGYEFAAAMTVPAALVSGLLTLAFLDEHRSRPLTRRTWLYVIGDYLLINTLLLLIPLSVMALNALAVKNCSLPDGLALFLLLPMVTMVFSVALALVVGSVFRRKRTLFVVLTAGILLHVPAVTVAGPSLFAYNPVLGFFPGITYDEAVVEMPTLLLFRGLTLLAALTLIALFAAGLRVWDPAKPLRGTVSELAGTFRQERVLWSCVLLGTSLLVTAWMWRSPLGFQHSADDIRTMLGRRSASDHFVFYYSGDDLTAAEVRRLKDEAEHHWTTVAERLRRRTASGPIDVYLYPSASVKRRYLGSATTNIARPWMGEVHLTSGSFRESFRHELVHAAAAEFGFPLIRASTRMGLNEGLAVAVDWEPALFTPHEYSAALLREGMLGDPASLFTLTGFGSRSSSYGYTVAGSFVRYLIDRFGIERVKAAFPNGNFVMAFHETAGSLVRDWTAFLKTVDATRIPPETVRALFSAPSIFSKECPRITAERNRSGAEALARREYAEAERFFRVSYADAPSPAALRGMMLALIAQGKEHDAASVYESLPASSWLRSHPAPALLAADALHLDGRTDDAAALYRRVEMMMVSDGYVEAAALRRSFIENAVPAGTLRRIYHSGAADSALVAMTAVSVGNGEASPPFLYAGAAAAQRSGNDSAASAWFGRFLAAVPAGPLSYYARLRCGDIEYERNDLQRAKAWYWEASNHLVTPASSGVVEERIARCDASSD